MSARSIRRHHLLAIATGAAIFGALVARHYATLDLALSHYDARGHLVVARRILDSITPGWQQIGAVWLPLPHLLNAGPVQIDSWYRSGLSAIALSIASYAVTVAGVAWIVLRLTASPLAAAAGIVTFAINPNILYLQSTPMTEPLLMALTVAAIALLMDYCDRVATAVLAGREPGTRSEDDRLAIGVASRVRAASPALVGIVFALACLTRYEAWPITIGALAAAVWALWRRGLAIDGAAAAIGPVSLYPLVAIAGFTIFSRIVVGSWFANDFFVPENTAQGHPYEAVKEILWGLRELSGPIVLTIAVLGAAILTITALVSRRRAEYILPLALIGSASVPWSAFMDGHPFRIRYSVPLIAVEAICVGVAAALGNLDRRGIAAALVVVAVGPELRPFAAKAPMVTEAQWDRPNAAPRTAVTAYLQTHYRGETIMASMGSLGHYMQDLSRAGFSIRDFLHEGNGDIWLNALDGPRPYAGWILVEEKAEGGDMLAGIIRKDPSFLDGYTRVAEGAGLALYRRER